MNSDYFLRTIWSALGGDAARLPQVRFEKDGDLPSVFAVSDLAAASIAAATLAVAEYASIDAPVRIDRRLASLWFGLSFRPSGWSVPPVWDPIAGDYACDDGWIRLHTNAPHHRAAALAVLNATPDKKAVASAVRGWSGEALETAIVERGGCAAMMRSGGDWDHHSQGAAVAEEPVAWVEQHPGATRRARDRARPLAGIRVLDLTRVLAGPAATRFLAGFGADVLRIDPPGWDEPSLVPEMTLGKRCARLDARTHRETLVALLAEADVIVHDYRPGALQRLGLDADTRRTIKPGIIDVSLDAYGWTGPWAGRRGFDSLVQMSGGIAYEGMVRLQRARPTPLPVQALDHATGYMMAAAVVRGLTEGAATIRLSLARTAALLRSVRTADSGPPIDGPDEDDFASEIESTVWGDGRRLRPPASIGETTMHWSGPAVPLGTHFASWTSSNGS